MKYPNTHMGTFNGAVGVGYEVKVSPQWQTNVITITGANAGTITTEAIINEGTEYETVINGAITLPECRTVRISGYPIKSFRFTQDTAEAFTVIISQFNPEEVSAR